MSYNITQCPLTPIVTASRYSVASVAASSRRLSPYRRKRDFTATPEPRGERRAAKPGAPGAFVIHLHHARSHHYDLRLQVGDTLRSWAVPKGPSLDPHDKRLAVQVEDHPLDYRRFEGEIPPGEYGAGKVWIWDKGSWVPEGEPRAALRQGRLHFTLQGERLHGAWSLIRTRARSRQPQWLLIKSKDEAARNDGAADDVPLSEWDAKRRRTPARSSPRQGAAARTRRPSATGGRNTVSENGGGSVRLTHPDRLLLPDPPITKQALADLYRDIASYILPGLVNRPLMLLRCPDGEEGECFFQKHAMRGFPPAVRQVDDRTARERWIYIDSLDGLIALVQMNAIEYHVWGTEVTRLDSCDRLIIDLDPAPRVQWQRVIDAALELRLRLDKLKLRCFVRTSGGKGLHVVVPLKPAVDWERARGFARALAESIAEERPRQYLAVAAKKQRAGKIFLDYLRNARGATAVCSYSLRKRPGAPIATPLTWDELPTVAGADQFRFDNIRERLQQLPADPWEGIERVTQRLPRLPARGEPE